MTTATFTQSPTEQLGELHLATFRVGKLLTGIDIRHVVQISRVQEITPVPHAPTSVLGVINLRGEVVTEIDLGVLLGLSPIEITAEARQVIVLVAGEPVGLLVDRVADITVVRRETIDPRPENLNGCDARFFCGVYQQEAELLAVLDLEQMLAAVGDHAGPS
jgi:purine-binding chemotaxis protein CheW